MCGRVGHSSDARFETCQNVIHSRDEQRDNFLAILEAERKEVHGAQEIGWPELQEVVEENRRSTLIYQAMVEHVMEESQV